MIVAGSHSHKGDTSLPTGWRSAPYPAIYNAIEIYKRYPWACQREVE
jgi:hypothetical protein